MRRRPSKLRQLRNLIFSIFIILLVITLAGLTYVWLTGSEEIDDSISYVETPSNKSTVITPKQPSPTAAVGVAKQSFVSPVNPGDNTSLSVRTNANSVCGIVVTYGEISEEEKQSNDSGLFDKRADEYGTVTWSWSVPYDAPIGEWPVEVTCENEKNSGYLRVELEIE